MRYFWGIFLVLALFLFFSPLSFAEENRVNTIATEAVKMAEKAIRMAEEAEKTADKALAQEALKLAEDAKRLAEKAMKMSKSSTMKNAAGKKQQKTGKAFEVQQKASIVKKKKKTKAARKAETGPGISIKLGKTKVTISGNTRFRFNSRDNLELNMQGKREDSETYIDQRFRLKVEGRRGPVRAVVLMDKGDIPRQWVQDSEGTSEKFGELSTASSFLVRWAYLQYLKEFNLKVGRQRLDVGHRIVLQGDIDAIDFSFNPVNKLTLGLSYMKPSGGYRSFTSGFTTRDHYMKEIAGSDNVFFAKNKLDTGMLRLIWRPLRTVKLEGYAIKVFDSGDSSDADLNLDKDFNASTSQRDGKFEPLWTGISFKGKKDKLKYRGEFVYVTGNYTDSRDIDAYAAILGGDYKIGSYSLGVEAGRGSGNKIDDTGKVRDFAGFFLCKFRYKYGSLFSEDIRAGFSLFDSNLSNITFYKGRVSKTLLNKKMAIGLSYAYIETTEKVPVGRGPVNGIYSPRDNSNSAASSTSTDTTRDVGHEIDATWKYYFDKEKKLSIFANLGYFIPGDVYKAPDGSDADPASEIQVGTEFKF